MLSRSCEVTVEISGRSVHIAKAEQGVDAMAAGIASLEDADYYKACNKNTAEVREYTKVELERRGFTLTNSKANFLFAKCDKIGGEEYYLSLKSKGVLVRHFKNDKIKDYVRITIGTKEQMDILLNKTDEILSEV